MYSNYKKRHRSIGFSSFRKYRRFTKRNDDQTSVNEKQDTRFVIACLLLVIALFGLGYEHVYLRYYGSGNLKNLTGCLDVTRERKFEIVGNFYVFYNFITGRKAFKCDQSITYSTYVHPGNLLHLEAAVLKFDGPFSVSVYTSGEHFYTTMEIISYLRNCKSKRIRKMVTFHLIFDLKNMPKLVSGPPLAKAFMDDANCHEKPPEVASYDYELRNCPVNIARNVAREAAQTHFILSADIELLPSPDLVPKFLRMLRHYPEYISMYSPGIFVLPAFQIAEDVPIPDTKQKLKEMLENNTANVYLRKVCPGCQEIPIFNWWLKDLNDGYMSVFSFEKKTPNWQPYYIGSRNDPKYDETLVLKDERHRLIESHQLCFYDYYFMVLNNAFLIQNPKVPIRTNVMKTQKLNETDVRIFNGLHDQKVYCLHE